MCNVSEYFSKQYKVSLSNPAITVEGHINHENSLVNDYQGRAIYELFQNAVDRADNKIWIQLDKSKKTLVVANDGEPFSLKKKDRIRSDFESLCSVNTSNKNQNNSIGNKGVGFKSYWEYTRKISIYSIHNNQKWGFEFKNPIYKSDLQHIPNIEKWSDNEYEDVLNRHQDKLPSFYFPLQIENNDLIKSQFSIFKDSVTIITFFDIEERELFELDTKIHEFSNHQLFFVSLLPKLSDKDINLELTIIENEVRIFEKTISSMVDDSKWLLVSKEFENDEELINASKELNFPVQNPKISIAFDIENKIQAENQIFYCYIPTQIKCGFNVLIHADFLLDNSRKFIDFKKKYNKLLLQKIAGLFVETLLTQDKLHNSFYFSEFLNSQNSDKEIKVLIWEALLKNNNLSQILRKVFTENRFLNINLESSSDHNNKELTIIEKYYSSIFNAMKSWFRNHESYESYDSYFNDVYNEVIKYFCDKQTKIVYISDDYVTSLPKKGKDERPKLFYTSKETINSLSYLKPFEDIALSSFQEIGKDFFQRNRIVSDYSLKELVRAIVVECEARNSQELFISSIKFIFGKLTSDNINQINDIDYYRILNRIFIPCIHDKWIPANSCYKDVDEKITAHFIPDKFYEIDFNYLKQITGLEANTLNEKLELIGAWIGCIPLIKDSTSLPWIYVPQISDRGFKRLILKSAIRWSKVEKFSFDELKKQNWFYDEINNVFLSPVEMFLFQEKDNRKMPFIGQEKNSKEFQLLNNFLGIKEINDLVDDSGKIVQQLIKMSTQFAENINIEHKQIYKQLTYRLSRNEFDFKRVTIPIMYSFSGNTGYNINLNEDFWVARNEYKKYARTFPDLKFGIFDDDINEKFLENIGVKIFKPEFSLEYHGERIEDNNFKIKFQTDYLPVLFAIASERLGSKLKEDIISKWSLFRFYKAENVMLYIDETTLVESTKDPDIDVIFKPNNKSSETNFYEIGFDLEDPFKNPNFPKFGYELANGLFNNLSLGSVFADYLSKEYFRNVSETDVEIERSKKILQNFLIDNGVSNESISEYKSFIEQNTLSEKDKEKFIIKLSEITSNFEITFENWTIKQYYINCNYCEIKNALSFNPKFEIILELINPVEENSRILNSIINEIKIRFQIKENHLITNNETDLMISKIKNDPLFYNYSFSPFDCYLFFGLENISVDEIENAKFEIDLTNLGIDKPKNEICFKIKPLHELSDGITISNFNESENNRQREKQHKRGIGLEGILARKGAIEILNSSKVDDFIGLIESWCLEQKVKVQNQLYFNKYLESIGQLKKDQPLINEIQNLLHISKSIGDGFGYDILYPEIENKNIRLLRVEVKSTSSNSNKIYLSENERLKILSFKNDKDWRLWLNGKEGDITSQIKQAVVDHNKDYASITISGKLFPESWVLEFS